jgi:hypothetical protein
MDQGALVNLEIDAGKRLLDRLVSEGVPVSAAGWLKDANDGRWTLYLVTPLVGPGGAVGDAYWEVNRVKRGLSEVAGIGSLRIRVDGPTRPTGKALLDLYKHHPGSGGRYLRLGGKSIGRAYAEDAYLYPLPTPNGKGKPPASNT